MANNIVAYIGHDSFDIILYLSRILNKLDHKVLLVDYSETSALTYSIPRVDGIDTTNNTITFRHVDFTRMPIDNKIAGEYDDILIDCGFTIPTFNLSLLTKTVYVTDMFRFRLIRLKQINYYDVLPIKKELLFRNVTEIKVSAPQMAALVGKQFKEDEINVLYFDEGDYDNAVVCHYNQTFPFVSISGTLKEYLLKMTKELIGDISDKQIKLAFKKARKGD